MKNIEIAANEIEAARLLLGDMIAKDKSFDSQREKIRVLLRLVNAADALKEIIDAEKEKAKDEY